MSTCRWHGDALLAGTSWHGDALMAGRSLWQDDRVAAMVTMVSEIGPQAMLELR